MQYDLVIVGTGFASSFFLKKYLDKSSPNVRVLVLERGYLHTHAQRIRVEKREADFTFPLERDYSSVDNLNPEKQWIYDLSFGGSSNCWWGCTPRFLPNDFQLNSLYGRGVDWPVTYEELDPYYTEAEALMHIAGPTETPFPRRQAYPQGPHRFNAVDRLLHRKYGSLYIQQPTARSPVARAGVGACCNNAACNLCPVNAKFTIQNTLKGIYEDERVSLICGAQVFALEVVGEAVQKVHYMLEAEEKSVPAETVALGANAIFNAHILLNSGDSHPLTGRGLSEQISRIVRVYLDGLDNVGGGTSVSANGYMLYDGSHRKDRAACLIESHNHPFSIRTERGKWLQVAAFKCIFEDLPEDHNRVIAGENLLKPQLVHTGYSEYAAKGVESTVEAFPKLLGCLPVEKIEFHPQIETSQSHILGTTRMANKPDSGVIDRHLIHHRWRNLWVLGSGAFPTLSPSNPTLTLSALSLWAADQSL